MFKVGQVVKVVTILDDQVTNKVFIGHFGKIININPDENEYPITVSFSEYIPHSDVHGEHDNRYPFMIEELRLSGKYNQKEAILEWRDNK